MHSRSEGPLGPLIASAFKDTAAVGMNDRFAEAAPQNAVEAKQQVGPSLLVDQLPEAMLASVLLPERFDEPRMGREVAIVGDGRIA
jgi:hypothetical protein